MQSEFSAALALARAGDAPRYEMRLRHWTSKDRHYRTLRSEAVQWVALYPGDAEAGESPVVVLTVRYDPDIAALEQGVMVTVWGWPEPGGAVHIACGELPITATSQCNYFLSKKKMPVL